MILRNWILLGFMFKKRVLVGLSGGVDSAVAAALLLDEGYEVVGGFMKCWSGDSGSSPCWIEDRRDALQVAAQLGIEVHSFDFEDVYREQVVEYMYAEYAAGRTPNPDVLCNAVIKFDLFMREADRLGCDFIATGHFVRTKNGKLYRGVHREKDQSYFLHKLTNEQLSRTLFPIGESTKDKIREIARNRGLCVADKRSTRGICFVGNVALSTFLKDRLPEKPGKIIDVDGNEVGEHNGVQFFTIGQRRGFGVGGGVPYYVVSKHADTNTVVVAKGEDHPALFVSEVVVKEMHWIGDEVLDGLIGQIRYQHSGVGVKLEKIDVGYCAIFDKPVKAVPPGQFLVLYKDEECLGGGVIDSAV